MWIVSDLSLYLGFFCCIFIFIVLYCKTILTAWSYPLGCSSQCFLILSTWFSAATISGMYIMLANHCASSPQGLGYNYYCRLVITITCYYSARQRGVFLSWRVLIFHRVRATVPLHSSMASFSVTKAMSLLHYFKEPMESAVWTTLLKSGLEIFLLRILLTWIWLIWLIRICINKNMINKDMN